MAGRPVIVRSAFLDQPSGDVRLTRFFPSAAAVTANFPTLGDVLRAFGRAGLAVRGRYSPIEVAAATRQAFLWRLSLRADSLLGKVPDDEYAAGLAEVRAWVTNVRTHLCTSGRTFSFFDKAPHQPAPASAAPAIGTQRYRMVVLAAWLSPVLGQWQDVVGC